MTNIPAFPQPGNTAAIRADGRSGMTLRDWFAGQALAGLPSEQGYAETIARRAYEIADAMLAERAK